ncbi:hypothetical protein AJ80_04945 [Polytolypa hystricis UAMH7299]|uniref:Guanine nucleotide-binding protein n=1 Tax=Polytolypa hystricis (strain UAMH7299) TaxID=1447883 RepID=A0A2B7Y868_POLH7|nr:hypothetical protein AJ80_04945 [Polytolypa hystricis UAMH7299]
MEQTERSLNLHCVASTPQYHTSITPSGSGVKSPDTVEDTRTAEERGAPPISSNYFKSAEWSADGTTVITNSADNCIRSFVLPPDLLDEHQQPQELSPYYSVPSSEPINALALYPWYSLDDASTTIVLSSVRDHPIRLTSALYPGTVASYSLISPTTEEFISPHSILYPQGLGGTKFLTGSDSLICLFDVSRPGKDGPISRLPTIPSKRKKIVGGGVGMKGIISTMAVNPTGDGILAAGTFTRHIGLYASNGAGDMIGTFSVAGTEADRHIGGKGVTQVLWSSCGRYLFVAERRSTGILVYDIRVTGQLVGWLEGRNATTNQRLKVDIVAGSDSSPEEIWAGDIDGFVRVWEDPTAVAGGKKPFIEVRLHDDPVSSAVVHPMGSVLATCSGQKQFSPVDDAEAREHDDTEEGRVGGNDVFQRKVDNSLKIWAL